MDRKQDELLAKLRETFRVEAAEHLDAIRAGLLAIERATASERASVVERIFREAHSFKGAARSVSLAGVEALCRELESIFAAMKRGELSLSTAMLDAIHPVLGVLDALCASPDAPQPPEVSDREQDALATLRRIASGVPLDETALASQAAAEASQPQGVPQVIRATDDAVPVQKAPTARPAAAETVRVSMHKLAAIVLETEELVGAQLAVLEHANELTKVAAELTTWNQQRIRWKEASGSSAEDRTSRTEHLETERLYTRKLENSLRRLAGALNQDARSLGTIADRVIEDAKKMLMLPCSHLLGAFPKMLRDLAREQGKEADLVVVGEDIEVDRRVLDELKDPLIHLLRNCADHGIELPGVRNSLGKAVRATVTMTVRAVGGTRIELTVADDGAGIDPAKVLKAAVRLGLVAEDEAARATAADVHELIFHSGLSTSPIITDLSGRGLGLAIVREKIERLGGNLSVTSALGAGTTFRMLVPMSLATFRGVFVEAAACRFVIPTASVARVSRITPVEIKTVENRQTIALGDRAVSLVRLRDLLSLSGPDHHGNGAPRPVVVVRTGDRQIALLVDDVQGEQEVMVRSLGPQLVRVRHIAGATISTSGAVIPILNVADLAESASTVGTPGSADALPEAASVRRHRLLVAEDSITARTLVKSILEAAGYEVALAVDGVDALTKLKTQSFDLVVSDVDMPRMNGFELTTKIRADKKLGELPVVLVTALGSQSDREYGIDVGANAYIVKSEFDQGNLLEIVRRLL